MDPKIYLNDLGIITSQSVGKKATLNSALSSGKRSVTNIEVEGKSYEVCRYKNYDYGNNRIDTLLDITCKEIEDSVVAAINKYGRSRIGVIIGSTDNGSEQSLKALEVFTNTGKFPKNYTLLDQQAHRPADYIKDYFNLDAISTSISTACTSSGSSIILADKILKSGLLDAVIVGGVDIVSDSVLKGFISLGAVDSKRTNPFSKNRAGINLGEACSLFLMSREKNKVSDNIFLAGYGETSDAHNSTAPDPEGKGAIEAINRALQMSKSKNIDYINLHGTGTILNDNMESVATISIFKNPPLLSSTKPIFGHTLGASSAVELGICWLLLNQKDETKLPIHIWDEEQEDNMMRMNFVSKSTPKQKLKRCMSNSYAFGGCNVSLIIEKEN